jgi:transketolase
MPGCVAVAMGRSRLPVVLRQDGSPAFGEGYEFRYGAIDAVRDGGEDAIVLAMGTLAGAAVDAVDTLRAEGRSVAVGVVSCPLDLDDAFMERATRAPLLVTVEDHNARTGLAASVAEWMALRGVATRVLRLGVDGYRSSGASGDLFAAEGLDAAGLALKIRQAL